MHEKIIRFRPTQEKTLDQFLVDVLDNPKCKYCDFKAECESYMGEETMEELKDYGCAAFDSTVTKLTEHYQKEFCRKGT